MTGYAYGSRYQTPGISFITLNDEARICRQFDMFDLAHQMKLCDELEEAKLRGAGCWIWLRRS